MSTKTFSRAGKVGIVLATAATATMLGAGMASAHVTAKVLGEPATKGGYAKITFRVPDEDPTAGTVKLQITLPADTPVASLSTKPKAGWTATVTKVKLATPVKTDDAEVTEAIGTVTWTASPGVRINPGEFDEFEVSGGPLPDNTDRLIIPTVQTYDNGTVVNWDAPPPAAGAEEPEHPAPVVALTEATADTDHHSPGATATASASTDTHTAAAAAGDDKTARWLGGVGIAVGILGLGAGLGAAMRTRRTTTAKAGD